MSAPSPVRPPLAFHLRLRLSVMMFLQFAVWGAWFVVLGNYLNSPEMGFSPTQIGSVYGTMALGAILSPMLIGQIADRYWPSQLLMALLHLAGGGLLYVMSQIPGATGDPFLGVLQGPDHFYWVTLAYALIYTPTLALSNSISFTHVPDATRDFPLIRVLGTIGWIAANLFVGQVLAAESGPLRDFAGRLMGESLGAGAISSNQPLLLGAGLSVVLGVFSLVLPHTPPTGKAGDAMPFLRALGLLANPSFAVFFGVSFIITIALAFYYGFTGIFVADRTLPEMPSAYVLNLGFREIDINVDVASLMTIGQIAEMLLLPILPLFLRSWGMKWVLVLGMASWGIRYWLFSIGTPYPLVLIGIALHGICFDFFLAAGFIHTDNKAPPEIRGSAQALFGFLTYGVGMWIGNLASGKLVDHYTQNGTPLPTWLGQLLPMPDYSEGPRDWEHIWLIPAVGVAVCLVIFIALFRDTDEKAT
jgi:nucleoside transporter